MIKSHSKSSKQWLKRQHTDIYAKQARQDGYRSRAAYKLIELNKSDSIFTADMVVVDLGAAPGGWSQVASRLVGAKGSVIAVDKIDMSSIPDVEIIIGDFLEQVTMDKLLNVINGRPVDLVMSDMAPNLSGIRSIDLPRAIYLAEIAVDLVKQVLRHNGSFLVKLFQGYGYEEYVDMLRQLFNKVLVRKPKASRSESSEVYLLAKEYRLG